MTRLVFNVEQECHSSRLVCLDTDQRTCAFVRIYSHPAVVVNHCAVASLRPAREQGVPPRWDHFVKGFCLFESFSCTKKTRVDWVQRPESWAALVLSTLCWPWVSPGIMIDLLKHGNILCWKDGRGHGQGNKQLSSKSNRWLTSNRSWRARQWRVWLTETTCIPSLTQEGIDSLWNNCIVIADGFSVSLWIFYSFQDATKMFSVSKSARNSVVENLLN